MKCPDCGAPMVLKETSKFKYGNGALRKFWGCSHFPECKATHGAHPDGKPLGEPGDTDTRKARMALHKICHRIWDKTPNGKRLMYEWLRKNAPKGHIGEMELDDIEKTKALLRIYFPSKDKRAV